MVAGRYKIDEEHKKQDKKKTEYEKWGNIGSEDDQQR
jgi:hypothetical protein